MKTRLVTYDDVEYGDIFTREGFGYAPIGTIIYRDGNVVPNGFLLCDGSTKSISSYSDLATYFQTTHGRKNYYGGNGSSTFGLPNIRRMPGNVSDELSTTEKIIGTYTNNEPLYQKVIIDTMPATSTTGTEVSKFISANISIDKVIDSNVEVLNGGVFMKLYTIVNGTGFGRYTVRSNSATSNKNGINLINAEPGWSNIPTYITIRYTKTTDSAVPAGYSPDRNGIWCIKATTDPTN